MSRIIYPESVRVFTIRGDEGDGSFIRGWVAKVGCTSQYFSDYSALERELRNFLYNPDKYRRDYDYAQQCVMSADKATGLASLGNIRPEDCRPGAIVRTEEVPTGAGPQTSGGSNVR